MPQEDLGIPTPDGEEHGTRARSARTQRPIARLLRQECLTSPAPRAEGPETLHSLGQSDNELASWNVAPGTI